MIRVMLITIALISGCKSPTDNYGVDIEWIYDAAPTQDALKAIEQGDFRFRGVYSYSLIVPGIKIRCIDMDAEVFPIEGTSDAPSSYEEIKFNAIAMVYAEFYNLQIRSHLERIGKYSCNK